jgi:hypothetical protein
MSTLLFLGTVGSKNKILAQNGESKQAGMGALLKILILKLDT